MANLEKASVVIVGLAAVNAGLAAIFGMDLISRVIGSMPLVVKIVYAVVGIAGIMVLVKAFK